MSDRNENIMTLFKKDFSLMTEAPFFFGISGA
jgi:hypothetical protein